MTKNIKGTIWATIAVMMVVIGITTYARQRPKQSIALEAVPESQIVITTPTPTPTATPTEVATSSPITVATSTPVSKPIPPRKPKPKLTVGRLSYGEAVKKYEPLRIQFSQGCLESHPNQIATKNPVTIMLDNRSDSIQMITVGMSSYAVKAYDYAIVTVNETILPMNVYITCNQQKNVALILLQK